MKKIAVVFTSLFILIGVAPTYAQDSVPQMPDPIKNLVDEGAQIRYLGRDFGLDSWLTIKNGQEQYFYVKPDQSAFVMGVMFDAKGKLVTVDQVQRLRGGGDTLLDSLASEESDTMRSEAQKFELQSPSERLLRDVEESNWVPLGQSGAPVLYSFVDPQCPHCHSFINDLRAVGAIKDGRIQVRLVPVGFREETMAQAAYLIATPDPQDRWMRHMDGDKEALPAKSEINQQGVQRNMAIMQSWKFNVTPMTVYRAKDGSVKIIRGRAQDVEAVISDVGTRS